MTLVKVIKEEAFEGYVVRKEQHQFGSSPSETVIVEAAYNPDGDYIGEPSFAKLLCEKYGIAPVTRSPEHRVCSIGFSERLQQWFGWSHRAIWGFGVGDVVNQGDMLVGKFPVGFKARSLTDARRMADGFAESVAERNEPTGMVALASLEAQLKIGLKRAWDARRR